MPATSSSHVCGFIATIRSMPPRRPRYPFSVTRTSYHVGKPWMFGGKVLRGETGTPIRMIDFANSSLADAEPEPLTLANLTTKSLTAWICFIMEARLCSVPDAALIVVAIAAIRARAREVDNV